MPPPLPVCKARRFLMISQACRNVHNKYQSRYFGERRSTYM